MNDNDVSISVSSNEVETFQESNLNPAGDKENRILCFVQDWKARKRSIIEPDANSMNSQQIVKNDSEVKS